MDLDAEIVDHFKRNEVWIPPYPSVVLKLQRLVADPAHSQAQVVAVLKGDPTLAGSVLRVANSAYYLRGEPATTLEAAATRIGEKELSRLALASGLSAQATAPGFLAPLRRGVWHDAMTAAAACELLAPVAGLAADELFVAGLLHDVGRLVALNTIEQVLKGHPDEPPRSAGEWESIVHRYHVELGLVLAAKWDLPEVHSDCISQHHEATPTGAYTCHVAVVAAADRIVAQLATGAALSADWLCTAVGSPAAIDWERLAVRFEQLPALVASFEDSAAASVGKSKVVPEPSAAHAAPETRFTLRIKGGAETPCRSASSRSVVFVSPRPMPENFLQELVVESSSGHFPLWLKIVRCVPNPAGAGFEAEGRLFAMSGSALKQWMQVACLPAKAA